MKIQHITEKNEEDKFEDICGAEVTFEGNSDEGEEEIQIEDLEQSPPKMEDRKSHVHDPMEKVDLSTMEDPRITYICSLLPLDLKENITLIIHEFKDCSALNYDEMPGLDRCLAEHRFPIKQEFHLFKKTT